MEGDPFDLIGDVLEGQFRVESYVGEGDLSIVYKGHHVGVDAPVAIKCLNLPATLDVALVRPLVDGFREASRMHYRLARGNLNIAQSIASGSTLAPRTGAVVPYLVREWFDGESLASDLARRREEKCIGRSVDETTALLESAVDGVAYAHTQGDVHLSLNPRNLFLAQRGDVRVLKVLDFGVARTMNEIATDLPKRLAAAGAAGLWGSQPGGGLRLLFPAYAAPEQLDRSVGEVGPWTDVYALALIVMEVLSDRAVMSEQDTGALVEHALDEGRRPTPQSHRLRLSRNLERALTRAVARAPEQRQKSAAQLWRDIKNAGRTTSWKSPTVPTPATTPVAQAVGPPDPAPLLASPPASASPQSSPQVVAPTPPRQADAPVFLRPKAATLSGVGAPVVVVGAVGVQPALPGSHAVPTKPMSFDPSPPFHPPLPLNPSRSPSRSPPLPASLPPLASPPLHPSPLFPPLPPSAGDSSVPPPDAPEVPEPAPPVEIAPVPLAEAAPANGAAASLWVSPFEQPLPANGSTVPPRVLWRASPMQLLVAAASLVGVALVAVISAIVISFGRPTRVASVAAAAPASACPEPAAAPVPPPVETAAATPPAAIPFSVAAARRALDATSHDVAKCKRGKRWGSAFATVTFDEDGSVSHVAVGGPFAGTQTGACVVDGLSAAHVTPFEGKPGVVVYRFYVAPR